jgi:hypothetical protein
MKLVNRFNLYQQLSCATSDIIFKLVKVVIRRINSVCEEVMVFNPNFNNISVIL